MRKKYEGLESIRGIAAISVVFSHLLITFPFFLDVVQGNLIRENLVEILSYTPIHLLWAGHEAVILFFVLSGFVLSLSIYNGKKESYKGYFIKRLFRIYVPYIIVMILSIFSQYIFFSGSNTVKLSEWIQSMWSDPFNFKILFHLLLMTGEYTHNYNTVAWSLIHELRISIIFPFLVFALSKTNWKYNIGFLIFVLVSSFFLPPDIPYLFKDTYYYLFFFIAGSLLAKYRDLISKIYQGKKMKTKLTFFVFSISLYGFKWNFGFVINSNEILSLIFNNVKISDLITGIGTVIIFIFATNSIKFENMLNHSFFKFFGKISYSLYLVHTVVLLIIVHSISEEIYPILLITLVFLSSILIAYLYNLFIEEPSNTIGKKISTNGNSLKKIIDKSIYKKSS